MQGDTYRLGAATFARGDTLRASVQDECLLRFVHRFTAEHVPQWASEPRQDGTPYPVQFSTDREWLENTHFAVKHDGTLDERVKHCYSAPTWPNNPELRR